MCENQMEEEDGLLLLAQRQASGLTYIEAKLINI
jgi:hypothetical protein